MDVEKIFEESIVKLLILLSAQYVEVLDMAINKKEITYLTIPKIQTSTLHYTIKKLAKLEPIVKEINSVKELRQEFKKIVPTLKALGDIDDNN